MARLSSCRRQERDEKRHDRQCDRHHFDQRKNHKPLAEQRHVGPPLDRRLVCSLFRIEWSSYLLLEQRRRRLILFRPIRPGDIARAQGVVDYAPMAIRFAE